MKSWKAGFPKPKPAPVKSYNDGWNDALRMVMDIADTVSQQALRELPRTVTRLDVSDAMSGLAVELAKGLKP